MRTDVPRPDDIASLIARRERLRSLTEAVVAAEEARPKPETYVDTARAMQAAALADRVLIRLTDDEAEPVIPAARQRLRVHADGLLDILEALPKPDSFRMSLSALRCILMADRLFVQIYSAPQAIRTPPVSAPETKSVGKPWAAPSPKAAIPVYGLTEHHARQCGVWIDGSVFDSQTPVDPHQLAAFDRQAVAQAKNQPDAVPDRLAKDGIKWQVATALTARINAISRHAARKSGTWPDQTRFEDTDPPYYAISALFGPLELGLDVTHRPDGTYDEIPGPDSFPWWLIHKIPARDSG